MWYRPLRISRYSFQKAMKSASGLILRPSSATIASLVVRCARSRRSPSGPLSTPVTSVASYSGSLSRPSTESSVFSCAPPTISLVIMCSTLTGSLSDMLQMRRDDVIAIQLDPIECAYSGLGKNRFYSRLRVQEQRTAACQKAQASNRRSPLARFRKAHDHRRPSHSPHSRDHRRGVFDVVKKAHRRACVERTIRNRVREQPRAELTAIGDAISARMLDCEFNHRGREVDAHNSSSAALRIRNAVASRSASDIQHGLAAYGREQIQRELESPSHDASPDVIDPSGECGFVVFIDSV